MMPENTAAYLTAAQSPTLKLGPAPYPTPRPDEILIRNHALAINPIDWILQDNGTSLAFGWLKYPLILGEDVSGSVVSIGSAVTRFRVGDRVLGQCLGHDEKRNSNAESAFQLYTILRQDMAAPIPDGMKYEEAAVLPLCVSTAACGLFQDDQLHLTLPSLEPKPTGKTLLIWGGSTSVGSNAIQLAVAAGYEVFTTASPKNFDYVKNLGAAKAFDYNSKTVIPDLIHAFEARTTAGAISIGAGAADACFDVLHRCTGDKFIAMATFPLPSPLPKQFVLPRILWSFLSWSIAAWYKSRMRGIRYNFINGTSLAHNGVGKAIYVGFLPEALARGSYVARPEPVVVGTGLECVQAAMEVQRKGMSAKKVVVCL